MNKKHFEKKFRSSEGGMAVLPEDMASMVEVNGKKRITLERLAVEGTELGELVTLELPDRSYAIGKILEMIEVPRTIQPKQRSRQIRFVLEIQPD